jgi:hypothetical protein
MTTAWEWVDIAVDQLAANGWPASGATAEDLANEIGISRGEMSGWLQCHRAAQRPGGRTRYVLQARSHGRGGRWHILAGPGDTARAVAIARRIGTRHVTADMIRRFRGDIEHELVAVNARGHGADPDLELALTNTLATVDVAMAYLEHVLAP